jgi:glycogen debranching enzyme
VRRAREWLDIDGISYIPSTVLLTGIAKVSLKDDRLFVVLDTKGECPLIYRAELGFYFSDTRHLSNWEMTLNSQQLVHLSHETRGQGNSCVFSMTNRDIPSLDGKTRIPRETLLVRRILTLYRDTVFEQVEVTNYDVIRHEIELQQLSKSRFDDIFEVRGMRRATRGHLASPRVEGEPARVVLEYQGLDGKIRRTFLQPLTTPPRFEFADDTATLTYRMSVPPKGKSDLKTIIAFNEPSSGDLLGEPFVGMTATEHLQKVETLGRNAFLGEIKISSDNQIFDRCVRNARLDVEMLTTAEQAARLFYPYAGLPWFSAPFGRDGLITSYQLLPWDPKLAAGVLDYVFLTQGTKSDSFTDEEPGKIFHEMRRGEMAALREIPYIPYYGSVDATPLALILLAEYVSWTHDLPRLRGWWPAALRALEWMDKWGDRDGDLFLEYMKRAPTGLDNQAWKDSHNSVMHDDGSLAIPPIKICEVQAYAFRARRAVAEMARLLGDHATAESLERQAAALKARFQERYWDAAENYVYLALDGSGVPCKVMSSNMGHCLWGKILEPRDGARVADHLMSPRLFSGYGIRTLAADEHAYNPLSYHNGSVWPHDNSMIGEGFRFYRQTGHLQTLADALFDVLATSDDFRLPELFCGFSRRRLEPPVPYEVACRPQAWAAGSLFLLIKSLIGLVTTTTQESIVFETPLLPSKVNQLEIQDLRVRDTEVSVLVHRGVKTCHVEITRRSGPMPVVVVK